MDLPKYESLDTQVLAVSVDMPGALGAFAEKLGLTYPLLSDFSRDTVKQYGVMYDDPNEARFRMAKRAYFVIDKNGVVRWTKVQANPLDLLDPAEVLKALKDANV